MDNCIWEFVPLPPKNNVVGCKWMYISMFSSNGKIEKHKSFLVSRGISQKEGIFTILKPLSLLLIQISFILYFHLHFLLVFIRKPMYGCEVSLLEWISLHLYCTSTCTCYQFSLGSQRMDVKSHVLTGSLCEEIYM